MMLAVTILLAIFFGGLRVAGVTSPAFQAAAHIFVGYIFTYWWFQRRLESSKWWSTYGERRLCEDAPTWAYFWIGVVLSVLELLVALHQRGKI